MKRQIVLIAHNLRSCHNVGSLLRTAEGLGINRLVFTGYTPYPLTAPDSRLPHIAKKIHHQIQKTALGAEQSMPWGHVGDVFSAIENLKSEGFIVAALEQSPDSISLPLWTPPTKIALIVGRETEGIEPAVLSACDPTLEIPMLGKKESFNVVQAAAMALYHCTYR